MNKFRKSVAVRYVRTPKVLRKISYWLIGVFAITLAGLMFLPWQQTIVGTGKVTVFSPMQRPQNLDAEIPARLEKWHVMEGQGVKKGQLIAELVDLDPKFLDASQIKRLKEQKEAMNDRKQAANSKIKALEAKLTALKNSREAAVPGAAQKVEENEQKLLAAGQELSTANYNFERVKELYKKGLRSKRDFELAELDRVSAQAQLRQAKASLKGSKFSLNKTREDASAKIADEIAAIASTKEKIASIKVEIAKLRVQIKNLEYRLEQRFIKSPIEGKVVRLMRVGSGETVSAGDVLATVAPETRDQAVELYVSAWDVPLISEGRQVRLQFAGWPAMQFTGWPMLASGTFAGLVSVIDAVDDGTGRYRILVRPDFKAIESNKDDPWPSARYLRPGAEAQGWVLLDTVSLGYELWRQFNAFPPSLQEEPKEDSFPNTKQKNTNIKLKL